MLLFIVGMAFFTLALVLVGDVVTLPARQRANSVQRAANYGRPRDDTMPGRESFHDRVVHPLRGSLAQLVLRLSPRTTLESVQLRLFAAGWSRSFTALSFLASKAALGIGGVVLGVFIGAARSSPAASVLVALLFGVVGYLLPDALAVMKVRSRRETIRRDLPDSLDLLAVSVEAGLGFDAAVSKVTERTEGPLAEELELVLGEMQIGESREKALKKLAERTDSPDVNAWVRSMVQADQLGMSIGRILRVQSSESRLKRQAAAEEKGMKAPIKMLFPTVIFIFPAMFIVILGPAFISLFELF